MTVDIKWSIYWLGDILHLIKWSIFDKWSLFDRESFIKLQSDSTTKCCIYRSPEDRWTDWCLQYIFALHSTKSDTLCLLQDSLFVYGRNRSRGAGAGGVCLSRSSMPVLHSDHVTCDALLPEEPVPSPTGRKSPGSASSWGCAHYSSEGTSINRLLCKTRALSSPHTHTLYKMLPKTWHKSFSNKVDGPLQKWQRAEEKQLQLCLEIDLQWSNSVSAAGCGLRRPTPAGSRPPPNTCERKTKIEKNNLI